MKFYMLWEKTERARELFGEYRRDGDKFCGAKMMRLKEVNIMDKSTREIVKPAYVVECIGTFFSYLRHKFRNPRGVFAGWRSPV